MVKFALPLVSLFAILPYALAQIKPPQCGGKGWTGTTKCPLEDVGDWYETCVYINEDLSECRIQEWAQCGGQGWIYNTVCVPGTICVRHNEFYSQCLKAPASK
ncbi:hypothetical protein BJ165DRAFT_1468605 [Panaeolus papilionaceus]|nr:hypothetical protein BJ165DRAFT_1468605 [Panaeolus papilionaceus]